MIRTAVGHMSSTMSSVSKTPVRGRDRIVGSQNEAKTSVQSTMMNKKRVRCPSCGETFDPDENVWLVCTGCGEVWEPEEDWSASAHITDESTDCTSPHAHRAYSPEQAEELSEKYGGDEDGSE